jgi:hypothetical protein
MVDMEAIPSRHIPITQVRCNPLEGRHLIEGYLFGGKFGPPRVPRGIEPEIVSQTIIERVSPISSPDVYERTLEAIRFYERADVVPHLMLALTGTEADVSAVSRSTYILQAAGDFGTEEVTTRASQYFDAKLVPHPSALGTLPQMLEALIALALAASPTRLAQRIQTELSKAAPTQNLNEEGMRNYQRLASYQRNDLHNAISLMDNRRRLASLQPDFRRSELVQIYLGQSAFSTAQMETWSARLLRAEAITSNPHAVISEFLKAIESLPLQKLGETAAAIIITRAAQAILYLQGKLSPQQTAVYEKARKSGGMNFLWDDLG